MSQQTQLSENPIQAAKQQLIQLSAVLIAAIDQDKILLQNHDELRKSKQNFEQAWQASETSTKDGVITPALRVKGHTPSAYVQMRDWVDSMRQNQHSKESTISALQEQIWSASEQMIGVGIERVLKTIPPQTIQGFIQNLSILATSLSKQAELKPEYIVYAALEVRANNATTKCMDILDVQNLLLTSPP
jgi:hypothetical protein